MAEQRSTVGTAPARVRIRKVLADVSQRQRAQDGVGDGMQQHVGIGMTRQAPGMGNGHATQYQRTSGHQSMNVEPIANAHRHR